MSYSVYKCIDIIIPGIPFVWNVGDFVAVVPHCGYICDILGTTVPALSMGSILRSIYDDLHFSSSISGEHTRILCRRLRLFPALYSIYYILY
jgi:hypothetical protein